MVKAASQMDRGAVLERHARRVAGAAGHQAKAVHERWSERQLERLDFRGRQRQRADLVQVFGRVDEREILPRAGRRRDERLRSDNA
jgi:hypothetical protein